MPGSPSSQSVGGRTPIATLVDEGTFRHLLPNADEIAPVPSHSAPTTAKSLRLFVRQSRIGGLLGLGK